MQKIVWQSDLHGKIKLNIIVWELWCFEDFEEKDQLLNQIIILLITKVIVEQPWQHWAVKNTYI